jgi:hypothetical protein
VIANAGVMRTPFGHTADGFETQCDGREIAWRFLAGKIVRATVRFEGSGT